MASGITDHDLQEVEAKLVKTLGRAVMPPELWGRLMQERLRPPGGQRGL